MSLSVVVSAAFTEDIPHRLCREEEAEIVDNKSYDLLLITSFVFISDSTKNPRLDLKQVYKSVP